jgi:hypothetical protein
MHDTLPDALDELLRSGPTSNPALARLLADYTRYHLVLVVVGSAFLLGLVRLGLISWRRFRAAPRTGTGRWSFEKRTCFHFAMLSAAVGLALTVIVAANVSNVVDPRHGFSGAVGLLGAPAAGTPAARLHQAFLEWLQSGSPHLPALVESTIDDRLAWQRPKAIISGVLLVGFVVLGARTWRALIASSRVRTARRGLGEAVRLVLGVVTVVACFVLMLMVIGNTQGSIAPIALTLFYG